MANKANAASKAVEEKDPEVKIENALGRTEIFFEKHWKMITTVVVILLVVVGGIYLYKGLYIAPQQEKAANAMFAAQQMMIAEDLDAALNGDGNNAGFLEIADRFGGTPQGKLAAHYAGIIYLKNGELDEALTYLNKYRSTKGVPNTVVNAQNEGLKGDVYVQKGELATAVKYYQNAVAEADDNSMIVPVYLKKLGLAQLAMGENTAAVESFRRIADQFPGSLEARDIEKYAAAAEQTL